MNVTVHSNLERPFVIEETDSILKKIKIRNDQSFLFYVLTGSINKFDTWFNN